MHVTSQDRGGALAGPACLLIAVQVCMCKYMPILSIWCRLKANTEQPRVGCIFPRHYLVPVVGVAVLGADNRAPSHHRAPLEMHMVHRNGKYKTREEALNKTDGILILAAIFEVSQSWAESLKRLRFFFRFL